MQLFDQIESHLMDYRINIKNSLIKLYENFCKEKMIEKKVVNICTHTFNRIIESNFTDLQRIVNIKI
jgi:hypothetical protein